MDHWCKPFSYISWRVSLSWLYWLTGAFDMVLLWTGQHLLFLWKLLAQGQDFPSTLDTTAKKESFNAFKALKANFHWYIKKNPVTPKLMNTILQIQSVVFTEGYVICAQNWAAFQVLAKNFIRDLRLHTLLNKSTDCWR